MNQLTPQEAALYLGQEFIRISTHSGCKESVSRLTAYDLERYDSGVASHSGIKLLLRPLADITEEEAKELVTMMFVPSIKDVKINNVNSDCITYTHKGGISGIQFDRLNAKQFAYLLSKGFDLFGFIEQGKALDKTRSAPSIEPASFVSGARKDTGESEQGAQPLNFQR